ncbi:MULTISPECIES: hypothetical protein [unclassified Mycolicibacterium]|uniref:hypothetical protein n=1 Tax=unclassified Mycolicibacterium TaxID=2636767 RepID=UPI001F4C48C8|nr:hypothetical protein [Mycolicibacterium sp. YH-1]UNB54355.1 hypothetical protein L0M16_08545 [Mycolicibacterium sp. YH-1]HET7741284.1 hypothetical protein [Mycobacterium sp.]
MTSIARLIALPIVSAGIIGGAALGLAGMANAQSQAPTGPGYSYAPAVKAHPAPSQQPGWHSHHGPQHVAGLSQR